MSPLKQLLAFAALSVGLADAASAHPRLVAASPAPNSTVAPPARLMLRFSERLVPRFSTIAITSGRGAVPPLATSVSSDGRVLIARPRARLAPGTYRVDWHVTSVDTHRVQGSYSFRVR